MIGVTIISALQFKETSIPKRRIATQNIIRAAGVVDPDTFEVHLSGSSESGDQIKPKALTIDNSTNIVDCNVVMNGIRYLVARYNRITFPIDENLLSFTLELNPIYDINLSFYVLEHHGLIPNMQRA